MINLKHELTEHLPLYPKQWHLLCHHNVGHLSAKEEAEGQKPFIKMGALQRLHNGAIWQQYEKHNQLLDAVYELAKEAVGEEKANAILDKHEVKRLN